MSALRNSFYFTGFGRGYFSYGYFWFGKVKQNNRRGA
jgi:hypothetical protein